MGITLSYPYVESFTSIKGFNGDYVIGDRGTVISFKYNKTRILKQEISKGYYRVTLSNNGILSKYLVHRLVGEYFISNPEDKPCINHKYGNKLDNYYERLEWCTYSENEKHSYNILHKVNGNRKLSTTNIKDIKANCIKGKNQNKPGNVIDYIKKYKVDRSTILNVLNNKYYV